MRPSRKIRRIAAGKPKPKAQRLKLQVAKGIEALYRLPEGVISGPDQVILRRIQNIHTGAVSGVLRQTDVANIKKIAKKHSVTF